MKRKLLILVVGGLLLGWLLRPAPVRAEGDPPPDYIPAPQSIGQNPHPAPAEGETADLPDPGRLGVPEFDVPLSSEPPEFVEAEPFPEQSLPADWSPLAVPLRYQQPSDTTCGVQSLGMALDFFALQDGTSAPSSDALLRYLQEQGMMYSWGTGVEELALAAHQFGYRGSYAFHDWTLEQLQEQVNRGRPVVVSLGSNGEDQPGHFVTVTGISPDGEWVAYNDPVLGRQVVSLEEFQYLWSLQGNSGVVAQRELPQGQVDPKVGLIAAIGGLAGLVALGGKRKGIGGKIAVKSAARPASKPAPKPEKSAAQLRAEAEAQRRAQEEARLAALRKAEAERKRREEEARRKAEEEARLAALRKAEEEKRRKEAEAKAKAEEARRKAEEEARLAAQRKAEEEKHRKAEEARLAAQRKAEEEKRCKEAAARAKAEAEEARRKAEEEARLAVLRKTEEEKRRREAEAKAQALAAAAAKAKADEAMAKLRAKNEDKAPLNMAKVQRLVAEREDEIEAEWNRRRKEATQQVPPPLSTSMPTPTPTLTPLLSGMITPMGTPTSTYTGLTSEIILNLPGTQESWSTAATALDVVAWLTDLYAAGVVTYGGVVGAGIPAALLPASIPEVPVTTGFAGIAIAELYVQPVLRIGNTMATLSTMATIVADTKSGDTRLGEGVLAPSTVNSILLTEAGWLIPEAYTSLALQSLAVSNDLGWTSLPYLGGQGK